MKIIIYPTACSYWLCYIVPSTILFSSMSKKGTKTRQTEQIVMCVKIDHREYIYI